MARQQIQRGQRRKGGGGGGLPAPGTVRYGERFQPSAAPAEPAEEPRLLTLEALAAHEAAYRKSLDHLDDVIAEAA